MRTVATTFTEVAQITEIRQQRTSQFQFTNGTQMVAIPTRVDTNSCNCYLAWFKMLLGLEQEAGYPSSQGKAWSETAFAEQWL